MKLTYLGTAAAEGFPAIFCNCKHCNEARTAGGKNIRSRSQSLINEDLLIDFPQDTYMHFLQNGIRGEKIKYLLITHAHQDHFYPHDLLMRNRPYAHDMSVPTLKLFCSKSVYEKFDELPKNVEITILKAYQTVDLGDYKITALPAKHMFDSEAFIYIIQADKTILYAHDTGYFYDQVFDFIEKNNFVFDLVSLDCTFVDIPISDQGTHMGFANIERVLDRLSKNANITNSTIKYVNHFSHNGNPMHHLLENRAKQYGCLASYDGCKVDL